MKQKEICQVIRQEQLGTGIYSLWLEAGDMAGQAHPGQFVMLYGKDASRLLPRPISICQTDGTALRLVYRVAGAGTEEFSALCKGQTLEVLGPLGNGFPLREAQGKRVLLLGGGIGIPPMLGAADRLRDGAVAVLGYKDETFLKDEFERACPVVFATEDGSGGVKGNVLDAIREKGIRGDMIFACGPIPMLRAVQAYAEGAGIPCWISMEERMACGIGACLGCVCDTAKEDAHSHIHRKRVCKDGPVFLSTEVRL